MRNGAGSVVLAGPADPSRTGPLEAGRKKTSPDAPLAVPADKGA